MFSDVPFIYRTQQYTVERNLTQLTVVLSIKVCDFAG